VAAPASREASLSKGSAFELLVETLRGVSRESEGPILAGLVKQSMKRKEPAFDETEYGYSSFARFLDAARDQGLVRLARDPRAGGYRVESADQAIQDDPSSQANSSGSGGSNGSGRQGSRRDVHVPVLSGEAGELVDALHEIGFHPWSHRIRRTIVNELVEHVRDRQERKKRNTLMYLGGDITRRCSKLEPRIPGRMVRSVAHALREAGVFLHSDGQPVRSQSAHFTIAVSADDLLAILRQFYLRRLMASGVLVEDIDVLSLLLWNDDTHQEAAQKLLELCHPSTSAAERSDPAVEADGVDDGAVLVAASEEDVVEPAPAPAIEEPTPVVDDGAPDDGDVETTPDPAPSDDA
jgi:hypothetical protein